MMNETTTQTHDNTLKELNAKVDSLSRENTTLKQAVTRLQEDYECLADSLYDVEVDLW